MYKLIFIILLNISLFSSSDFNDIKSQYFKSYDYEQMGRYSESIKVLIQLYNK